MATKISKSHKSVKHDAIIKDNTRIVLAVAFATFIVVFCIFATRALLSQSLYHGRVISGKEEALSQLEDNKQVLQDLEKSYSSFVSEEENILGGSSSGEEPLDGNNAKLVLNALPSAYDYPALSSSFEKILKDGGYTINSIGGSEDSGFASSPTSNVHPIEMPYSFSFTATTERTKELLVTLEHSIRPMYVDNIQIQAGETTLLTRVTLHTFFTQEKTFELGFKEVK